MQLQPGSAPDLAGRAYSASPDPLAGFKEVASWRWGEGTVTVIKKWRGREGEEMLTDVKLLPNRLNRKPISGSGVEP